MKVLLDTSVFLPVLLDRHPYHEDAKMLLTQVLKDDQILVLNTHLIAELYSNLTRYPQQKVNPNVARQVLKSLATQYDSIDLTVEDYLSAVDRCADKELVSGVIFDALHFEAAIKGNVDVLYTGNLRDFERLMTDEITFEIKSPF